jgi:hypothetical protein
MNLNRFSHIDEDIDQIDNGCLVRLGGQQMFRRRSRIGSINTADAPVGLRIAATNTSVSMTSLTPNLMSHHWRCCEGDLVPQHKPHCRPKTLDPPARIRHTPPARHTAGHGH